MTGFCCQELPNTADYHTSSTENTDPSSLAFWPIKRSHTVVQSNVASQQDTLHKEKCPSTSSFLTVVYPSVGTHHCRTRSRHAVGWLILINVFFHQSGEERGKQFCLQSTRWPLGRSNTKTRQCWTPISITDIPNESIVIFDF